VSPGPGARPTLVTAEGKPSNQTAVDRCQDRPEVSFETRAGVRRSPLRATLPGWRSHRWREDTDPELTMEPAG
jgi:hypothetical protein